MPRRYRHCTLDNYQPRRFPSLRAALGFARAFVENFPAVDRGLLFTGDCGTGKTHLAAAILRQLVVTQGIRGVFADYQDLLKRIQATFSRNGEGETEDRILAPVLEADLLVLDDLGSRRSTAWVEETIGHVLNVRYNEQRLTLITTNLRDIESAIHAPDGPADDNTRSLREVGMKGFMEHVPGDTPLLSERVDERVISRMHEMCRTIRLDGPDYRRERFVDGGGPAAVRASRQRGDGSVS